MPNAARIVKGAEEYAKRNIFAVTPEIMAFIRTRSDVELYQIIAGVYPKPFPFFRKLKVRCKCKSK